MKESEESYPTLIRCNKSENLFGTGKSATPEAYTVGETDLVNGTWVRDSVPIEEGSTKLV